MYLPETQQTASVISVDMAAVLMLIMRNTVLLIQIDQDKCMNLDSYIVNMNTVRDNKL